MRSPSWPDPLYGQCKCGATLTVDHLRNHCPLNKQQADDVLRAASLEALVAAVYAKRLDTEHVAVLGEN